ncbi:MAG: hypothetical protein WB526_12300 [Candidatus Cybelea sp.]
MRMVTTIRLALRAGIAAALLAGCGGPQPPVGAPGGTLQDQTSWVRPDRGESSMESSASKTLLYVDDDTSNDTYVFDYPSGKLVGNLTGFYDPKGMCVDQKGDVYISNSQYGLLIEYAHGGTKPINIYQDPGTSLIGCSISAKGDVAAYGRADQRGSNVCIWKGGNSDKSPKCIYASKSTLGSAFGLSTCAYDHDGDLVGLGGYNGILVPFMIPAGKTTMEKLTTSGIRLKIHGQFTSAENTSWDGEYITLGLYQNRGNPTVLQPVKVIGTTLTAVGSPIPLRDNCRPSFVGNPLFFGAQNVTAASTTRATLVTGPPICDKSAGGVVDEWNYPKTGKKPILRIPVAHDTGGDAVSIAE